MMFLLISSIIGLIFLWVFYKWSQVRKYWKDYGVPHEQPNPFYGSLNFILKKNGVDFFLDEYEKYKGSPYFGIWLFWRPALVVRDPEIAKRILVKDFDVFKNRLASAGKHDKLAHTNLFFSNDLLWSSTRKILSPVYTSSKLRMLQRLYSEKAEDLVKRIRADNEAGKKIELRELFADYMTGVLASTIFGVEDHAIITRNSPLRKIIRNLMEFSLWRAMSWGSLFLFPEASSVFRFTLAPKEVTDYLRKYFAKAVEQKGERNENSEIRDLLDALLEMKRKSTEDEEFIENHMLSLVLNFVQAGFETTASTQTYILYELAHNPDVQQKLYKELREVVGNSGNENIDSQTLADLTYLNCVIKETMRKYPIIGFLDRIANEDYKIDDKLTIKKGTPVITCMPGLHLDPKYWPEPKKFNPDRFLPENKHMITPYTYMPFGEGPRNCLGLRSALQAMAYSISRLILAFELRPLPGTPLHDEIVLSWKSTIAMPAHDVHIEFTPRKDDLNQIF